MDSSKKFVNPSPEIKANFLSKLFFCWILPFMKYGYHRDLEVKDVYNAVDGDLSSKLGDKLEENWKKELKKADENNRQPSLKRAIFKTFWKSYAECGVYVLFRAVVFKSLQPIVLAEYIAFFEEDSEYHKIGPWMFTHHQAGWILAGLVVLLAFLIVVILHYGQLDCCRIGMRVRVACCSVVYRKFHHTPKQFFEHLRILSTTLISTFWKRFKLVESSPEDVNLVSETRVDVLEKIVPMLKLSQASLGQTAAGQVVNLMSNDVERFDQAAVMLHFIWIMPVSFATSFYIMFESVGLAAIAVMIAIALQAIPLQGYLSKKQGNFRYKIAQRTDYRVKLMSEIVSGIQVIKMYAWEKPFEKLVEMSRKLEVKFITKTSYIKGITSSLAVITERFILYLTIMVNLLLGNRPTSNVVFSMAQLVNTIQLNMCIMFPNALSGYAEAKVTIKRLENFLLLEENNRSSSQDTVTHNEEPGQIFIKDASASWLPNPVVNTLIDINLNITPGTLCCVVGNVGSGKSSLLQMLLKELPLKKGHMDVGGHISYASQEPWLFVSNVRNNILFGQPYLKKRYNEVVDVCALEKDFLQFPHGDKTLVGERGVSLSGGQRARINLARAVYSEADIYLFDDPLSAVDTHVGKHLFEKCIKNYLNGKTRILATHQLQFLKQADMVIVLNNGKIESVGTFSELSDNNVIKSIQRQDSKNENEKQQEEKSSRTERLKSIVSIASSFEKELEEEDEPDETQELMEKGQLSSALYVEYYRSGSNIATLLLLVFLLLIAQIFCNACDLWVNHWTSVEQIRSTEFLPYLHRLHESMNITTEPSTMTQLLANTTVSYSLQEGMNITTEPSTTSQFLSTTTLQNNTFIMADPLPSEDSYVIKYTILIVTSMILTIARSILFYKICMNASKGIHNKMFANVLKAPMRFFDTNPSGRILNRFSKDIGAIDEILPKAFLDAIQIFLVMAGILAMNFIVTVWMIIPTVLLGILFYYLRTIYLSTAQDIKRIEGVTRAPVFSHISATLYGISTIRSSNAEDMITQEFDSLQDQHTGSYFIFLACSEAFGFYLDCISTLFLALVTFQFLLGDGNANSADVGLVISSSLILTGMLQLGVRQTAEVTSNMTSVERLVQYTKIKTEDDLRDPPTIKPVNWPKSGKVTFKNTYLRYALEEPPVLKNLNIVIEAGEKVGIVGRTGAGKSTLIASLFRLAPIDGEIAIDGIDTAKISLEDLRSNISIIPQEPILFSSTVRHNLDPFDKANDDDIWKALADVELKSAVESLDQQVSEGGSNFSAGQRQLVCLARAILRNNKILVMDEATANVDPHTDSLIQKTIRNNFKDCTVLTIAHRLNTIMDSDKVLVMNAGEAMEYAPPHELLQLPDGYFTKMVEQTGPVMEAQLRKIAKDAYKEEYLHTDC